MNFPECVKCYSCGFMKKGDSETEKLPGDVPFCNGELACFGSVKIVKINTSSKSLSKLCTDCCAKRQFQRSRSKDSELSLKNILNSDRL